MTAKKSKPAARFSTDGDGVTIDASQPAEAEKDVVGEAKPVARVTAESVAWDLAESYNVAEADGNRLTITFEGPNGLVQTFHATVEEGIREF